MKIIFTILFIFIGLHAISQLTIVEGTVYDSAQVYGLKNVMVKTKFGKSFITDSSGKYKILVDYPNDSIYFSYNGKRTLSYDARTATASRYFDVSILVNVNRIYKPLPEVVVRTKSYEEEKAERDYMYRKVYEYDKEVGVRTMTAVEGGSYFDANAFFNMFRFKHNKNMREFKQRLVAQEKEKYVDYKFNKRLIKRITRLPELHLDKFMKIYRPSYEWLVLSTLDEYYSYILRSSYVYRQKNNLPPLTQTLGDLKNEIPKWDYKSTIIDKNKQ